MNTSYLKEAQGAPEPKPATAASTNACNQCMPLGACLAYRGFAGTVPFLHGSQGCATYIRRYLISHFREPMDIASSSFSEETVIFGGERNLRDGVLNVGKQYKPELIAVATTCLAETIGDDIPRFIRAIREEQHEVLRNVDLMFVSTPSYHGAHTDGYWAAVRAVVGHLAEPGSRLRDVFGICPGMVSPANIRHLKEWIGAFKLNGAVIADYSETLDGASWDHYLRIPPGGTPLAHVRAMGRAEGFIEFTSVTPDALLPGALLHDLHGITRHRIPAPIGIDATDRLMKLFSDLAGCSIPAAIQAERGRLIDALVDGHKYVASCPVAIYGDEETVFALTAFAVEIGMKPVLCATGARRPDFKNLLLQQIDGLPPDTCILADADFAAIEDATKTLRPELLIGNSKGYAMSRRLGIPLLRAGFPVHDRLDGARLLSFGYRGAQNLFDRISSLLIETRQNASSVGYTYM